MLDFAIVGAGVAGSSAAIFLGRAKKRVTVFDHDQSATKKAWVENHFGVMGMTGYDLFESGKIQAEKTGSKIVQERVEKIAVLMNGFEIYTDSRTCKANQILLASGLSLDLAHSLGLRLKKNVHPHLEKVIDVDAEGHTSIPGIWAAGLCAGTRMQTIITAGNGAEVALNMIGSLNGEYYADHDAM